jgi:hypothetical protein
VKHIVLFLLITLSVIAEIKKIPFISKAQIIQFFLILLVVQKLAINNLRGFNNQIIMLLDSKLHV